MKLLLAMLLPAIGYGQWVYFHPAKVINQRYVRVIEISPEGTREYSEVYDPSIAQKWVWSQQ